MPTRGIAAALLLLAAVAFPAARKPNVIVILTDDQGYGDLSCHEPETLLSPADWMDVFLDQSAQVRRGERKNGAWNLWIERAGSYEIELRRWPAEADAPIRAGTPKTRIADGEFPAGLALQVARARLRVGSFDRSLPVGEEDRAVRFAVRFARGPTELRTWFHDAAGQELCGAYYVYVRRGREGTMKALPRARRAAANSSRLASGKR